MNPRVARKDDPAYLRHAISALGLSEIAGPEHEPRVLAMYAACGHPEIKRDEVAWCAAFVGWALVKGGLPTSQPISQNLLAISYAKYPGQKLNKYCPIPRGAIGVWPRDQGSGHVNFILEDQGEYLLTIGGNQGNGRGGGVTIAKYPKHLLKVAVVPAQARPPVAPKPPVVAPVPPPPDIEPTPSPELPPPAEEKKSFLEKISTWIGAMSGLSFLGALTDWQIVAVFTLCLMFIGLTTLGVFILLFGLDRVRAWIRRKVNR
jgi:uncharacterized protein (TIGR02594 family)